MSDRIIEIRDQLKVLVRSYFDAQREDKFELGRTRLPLSVPSYGWEEVWEALDSLLSTKVTMGEKVHQFEASFAKYIGVKHAVMVNSGSSANLLALSVLANPQLEERIRPGDEIITPAVTWATTVFPIINVGATPVLVDVDLDTFNLIPEELERAITPKTRAIMLVHLLGTPCEMGSIMDFARKNDMLIIEDACEAHGAEYRGKKVGSFGDLATFSFYFSHHMTTIEGGMLLTSNGRYAELARAMRAFGWIRDLDDRESIAKRYPEIDPRYLFATIGYNLRPTEIQGAFGIHQMGKLEERIERRRENAAFWGQRLSVLNNSLLLHQEAEGTRNVWLGYPLMVRPGSPFTRKDLVDHLEARGVETRPIMTGSIDEQPAMRSYPYRKTGDLPKAQLIHHNAFFFGNHDGIGSQERDAIASYIEEFTGGWD